MFSVFLILLGIALLYIGGEFLVSNAIHLAQALGVSSMVIGLTVVAFATSAPELAATLTAALEGSPDMAVGNAFGSNVANLGLILGTAALLFPMKAGSRFVRREVLFMVAITVAIYPVMWSGALLSRLEGFGLLALLFAFLYVLIRDPESQQAAEDLPEQTRSYALAILGVIVGIALLTGGAKALVAGASDIARRFQISELVIGLTVLALGTSLPELAASVVAARKRESDLVLGNIVGSNIFNLLCILGVTAMVRPIPVAPDALGLNYLVMLGITLLVLGMLYVRKGLARPEGVVLLSVYLVYTAFLFWQA